MVRAVAARITEARDVAGNGSPATHADVPAPLWLRSFPGQPSQVREARHWIENILPDCDPREILVQIASEFCSNTIEHTRSGSPGGRFTVHLAWSASSARLTVGDDDSDEAPAVIAATLESEHGRGLGMVDLLADAWDFADDEKRRWLWADVSWLGKGGPARIGSRGAMPAAEAVRKLGLTYPGIQIGYGGDPATWWALQPGDHYPDDQLAAPCFGALAQMTAAAWRHAVPG